MNTSADPSTAPPKLTTNPRSVSSTPIAVKKASSTVDPTTRWVSVGFFVVVDVVYRCGRCRNSRHDRKISQKEGEQNLR